MCGYSKNIRLRLSIHYIEVNACDRSWAMMYYKVDFCVHKEYCLAKCKQIFVSTNIFLWLSGHI